MKQFVFLLMTALGLLAVEPKVTLVYGSWNPGEGGPVTTRTIL